MSDRASLRPAELSADRGLVGAEKARMVRELRGQRLRELREQSGMSRAEIARRTGVGKATISLIERGDVEGVRLGKLRAYARALGADIWTSAVVGDERSRIG